MCDGGAQYAVRRTGPEGPDAALQRRVGDRMERVVLVVEECGRAIDQGRFRRADLTARASPKVKGTVHWCRLR